MMRWIACLAGAVPTGTLLAGAVLAASIPPVAGRTDFEIRGASTDYRYADVSYTHASGVVFDGVYTGFPDFTLLNVGAGYEIGIAKHVSLTPLVYAVKGTDTRGVTLGGYVAAEGRRWRTLGFIGHFFQTGGDVPGYSYIEALELTWMVRMWEVGALLDASGSEEGFVWLAGPLVKRNDALGAWGLAARGGAGTEVRLIRTLSF